MAEDTLFLMSPEKGDKPKRFLRLAGFRERLRLPLAGVLGVFSQVCKQAGYVNFRLYVVGDEVALTRASLEVLWVQFALIQAGDREDEHRAMLKALVQECVQKFESPPTAEEATYLRRLTKERRARSAKSLVKRWRMRKAGEIGGDGLTACDEVWATDPAETVRVFHAGVSELRQRYAI